MRRLMTQKEESRYQKGDIYCCRWVKGNSLELGSNRAGALGIEPRNRVLETRGLPLAYAPWHLSIFNSKDGTSKQDVMPG